MKSEIRDKISGIKVGIDVISDSQQSENISF